MYKKIISVIVVLLIGWFLFYTPYYIVRPGKVDNLRDMVKIEEMLDRDDEGAEEYGSFHMVTVVQHEGSLFSVIQALFNPYRDILHQRDVVPDWISDEEYREILERWMEESKMLAQTIALLRAGYEVEITGEGIEIHALVEDSPAVGILQEGDIILQVDGEEVFFTDQVQALVQNREIGDPVSFLIERDDEELNIRVETGPFTKDGTKPGVGVYITAREWEPKLPLDIDIATGQTTGPSAGMMFVLEILNQLMPGDLTGGRMIAGSGTINYFEDVGTIGGIKQKARAAEKAGVEIFFLPDDNLEELQGLEFDLKLVPVNDLQDIIDYLNSINVIVSDDLMYS